MKLLYIYSDIKAILFTTLGSASFCKICPSSCNKDGGSWHRRGPRYLPASSPHLNTTENLWTNLKFDIYCGGRRGSSLNSILEAEVSVSENSDCVKTRMRTDSLAGRPIAVEKRAVIILVILNNSGMPKIR